MNCQQKPHQNPAQNHGGAAVAYEGQRQTRNRQEPHSHTNVYQHLKG